MSDDRYTMKIPRDLRDFLQKYIKENPELGFNKVSQLALYILQEKVFELKKEMEKKQKQ